MKNINKVLLASFAFLLTVSLANAQNVQSNVNADVEAQTNTQVNQDSKSGLGIGNFIKTHILGDDKAQVADNTNASSASSQSDTEGNQSAQLKAKVNGKATVENIWGDVNKDNLKFYVGTTNDASLNTQIQDLRASYVAKIQTLRNNYLQDLKDLIGDATLTVQKLPLQSSATASASVNSQADNGQNQNGNQGLHVGFWSKIKAFLGFGDNSSSSDNQ